MNNKSHYFEAKEEWREQAKALFFIDHLSVTEIAAIVNKARETVSRYITDCDGYDAEMEYRKNRSALDRKEYQRQWDRDNRKNFTSVMGITGESLRREHVTAVKILSGEKY